MLSPLTLPPRSVCRLAIFSGTTGCIFNDVTASADFYLEALQPDERNPELLQQGFVTQYRNGNIDMAAALARRGNDQHQSAVAVEPAISQAVTAADWDAVIVLSASWPRTSPQLR